MGGRGRKEVEKILRRVDGYCKRVKGYQSFLYTVIGTLTTLNSHFRRCTLEKWNFLTFKDNVNVLDIGVRSLVVSIVLFEGPGIIM